jgi:hypothetical protein
MRLFLLKAWPALIPLALYLLWLWWRAHKGKKGAEVLPDAGKAGRLAILATLITLAACLFYYGLSQPKTGMVSYEPTRFQDGKLIKEELK